MNLFYRRSNRWGHKSIMLVQTQTDTHRHSLTVLHSGTLCDKVSVAYGRRKVLYLSLCMPLCRSSFTVSFHCSCLINHIVRQASQSVNQAAMQYSLLLILLPTFGYWRYSLTLPFLEKWTNILTLFITTFPLFLWTPFLGPRSTGSPCPSPEWQPPPKQSSSCFLSPVQSTAGAFWLRRLTLKHANKGWL